MHHWGNHALETESVSNYGNNISSFPFGRNNGSHWGFTGGNVNGQLGGFIQSTLQEYDDSIYSCLLYTSPSPRDKRQSRMPSSA